MHAQKCNISENHLTTLGWGILNADVLKINAIMAAEAVAANLSVQEYFVKVNFTRSEHWPAGVNFIPEINA